MRYLILILLVGCAVEIPGQKVSDLYPEEVSVALSEWAEIYGETPDVSDISVVTAKTDAEYYRLCGSDAGDSLGCYINSTIVIRTIESEYQEKNIVTHELMHALGIKTFGPGGGDGGHHDPEIWAKSGILYRINADLGLLENVY